MSPRQAESDFRHPVARLSMLLDAYSLTPLHDADDSDAQGVRGSADGHKVFAYCTDARVMGGAAACRHIADTIEAATREALGEPLPRRPTPTQSTAFFLPVSFTKTYAGRSDGADQCR